MISQNAILKYILGLLWVDGFLFFVVLCSSISMQYPFTYISFLNSDNKIHFTKNPTQPNPKKPKQKRPQRNKDISKSLVLCFKHDLVLILDVTNVFWLRCLKRCVSITAYFDIVVFTTQFVVLHILTYVPFIFVDTFIIILSSLNSSLSLAKQVGQELF